jgi:sialate O-acetylesterase
MKKRILTTLFCLSLSGTPLLADIECASPFSDGMILQRDQEDPVWGKTTPNTNITVTFSGSEFKTVSDPNGKWSLNVGPFKANAKPQTMTVATPAESITIKDVLVGDVWLCGGQSNMERQLGPREGQQPLTNWESEVAGATNPLIRQLYVKQTISLKPEEQVEAKWTHCTPENVINYSAVAYYFAKHIQPVAGVPVGIIHASWGGTPAEAWTSFKGIEKYGQFNQTLDLLKIAQRDPEEAMKCYQETLDNWYKKNDRGAGKENWASPDYDSSNWKTMKLPVMWENAGYPSFDGIIWFRKEFTLPDAWEGKDLLLSVSSVDDIDVTWVNGTFVGTTDGWITPREYIVPAKTLREGVNVIACRALDTGGGGGIWNPDLPLQIEPADKSDAPISLAGNWNYKLSTNMWKAGPVPPNIMNSTMVPTVLYNGMINPLVPYAIKGAIFYQGEANAPQSKQYQTLLPAMIQDWRDNWGQGAFPFLFVQIAPFRDQPPEIREAQLIALKNTKNTGMAVTIDVGDAEDIHPANKEPAGKRLALAARALAYGENIEYSGPLYESVNFKGNKAILNFSHVGDGLVAPGGSLYGFTICGKDGNFYPAKAIIVEDKVEVSSDEVARPTAVRYGWKNVASGNLFNKSGLPASPFRTNPE